ncbi:unnamed protein product [Dicrocoelium dendriticum]|nr:unnamed protein product [Dicrocoelium dendriticum]
MKIVKFVSYRERILGYFCSMGRFRQLSGIKRRFEKDEARHRNPGGYVQKIVQHLEDLVVIFFLYYSSEDEQKLKVFSSVNYPFTCIIMLPPLTSLQHAKFIDMLSDSCLHEEFHKLSLSDFWCKMKDDYPIIAKTAVALLLQFVTTYLCEKAFLHYTFAKAKYRN